MLPISADSLSRTLSIRDLTDPSQGPHALQRLVDLAARALALAWECEVRVHRGDRIVPVSDNYDRLRYPPDAVARDARYTRYVDDARCLRTQTSALIPPLLDALASESDVLLVCPGIVYRRDSVDRLHSGEPHQLDLWRIRRGDPLGRGDLLEMIELVVAAILPGRRVSTAPAEHPYTTGGLEIRAGGVEIGECGLAHTSLVPGRSGLAMGLGLDRLLMLRKGLDDIRLLRSSDPRIAIQMLDLEPWRPVSHQPPIRRDLSIVASPGTTLEELGDSAREALGADARAVEEIAILSTTPAESLPPAARDRLGIRPGEVNLLVRVVIRDLDRTLTSAEANAIRERIWRAWMPDAG